MQPSNPLDHGTRRNYLHGCRCTVCRAANAAYVATQRRCPTGSTDATAARTHLASLARAGLGSRQLAHLAGLSRSTIRAVLDGTSASLRPATAATLLGLAPILAHGTRVPGTKTHRFLDSLRREGFTRREIAFHLGARSQQLQLHHTVTVRSALRVATLYSRLAAQ